MPSRLEILTEMLQKEPDDSFLNYATALEYAKVNNNIIAIEILEKIIQQDPDYLATYYQLGKIYSESGEIQKAAEAYNKGIEVAQKQKDRKTLGELQEALELLED